MVSNSGQIPELVMRMQDAFLEAPSLKLTVTDAQQRFGVDAITCQAVLGALVEAGVLARDEHAYVRYFPRAA